VGVFVLVVISFIALYRFVDWLNDTYEVTTRAVIHTEKRLFFSAERYEIPLQQIQNVTIRVGVIGRYLDFGNVDIDTAAAKGQIAFTTIPRPAYVQTLIQKASAQARSGLTMQRRESIRQQIEDQLYPERLKPSIPGSVLIPPEESPEDRRQRPSRFRAFRGWLPRFEIREDGQVIWRKHWINLLQRTGVQFILLLVSIYLVLSFALASLTVTLGLSAIMLPPVTWLGFQGWLFMIVLVLSILAALWFIYQYVDWRNDIYIVTDDEVIDVERDLFMFPFFFLYTENRRQASLTNVQYVDLKIPNPLAMILNYGNVIVQTAGAEGTLDFLWVSNPRNVHAEILRRLTAFEERNREREFQERWGDMPRWFETYRDVVDQTSPPNG
jgi:membrane protein YdbS with pleckstrin-like domain